MIPRRGELAKDRGVTATRRSGEPTAFGTIRPVEGPFTRISWAARASARNAAHLARSALASPVVDMREERPDPP